MKRLIDLKRILLLALSVVVVLSVAGSCIGEHFTPEVPAGDDDGSAEKTEKIDYFLSLVGVPDAFGDGEEFTFSFIVRTNIPLAELELWTPDWISASMKDSVVTVVVSENSTYELRRDLFTVNDPKLRAWRDFFAVTQDWHLVNGEGCVPFADRAFKKACLDVVDRDNSGDVELEEAEAVEELVLVGKGIKDLTGLDWFKNVWKLDLGDNDVEDAMIVTNLHYLHWLNLKGNKNLKCFDVRGCTSYFEVCDFEVTEDLNYYLHYRYMGVTWPDDKNCLHSHHSRDPRETVDWSRQDEIYQVYHHTVGQGRIALIFSGIGWIDVDVNDGTFERIVHQAIEALKEQPGWAEHWEYFDVYVMINMANRRCQWMYWDEDVHHETEEEYAKIDAYNAYRKDLEAKMRASVNNDYCFTMTIDSHANMRCNSVCGFANVLSAGVPKYQEAWTAPINGYDNRNEGFYYYTPIVEAMKTHRMSYMIDDSLL